MIYMVEHTFGRPELEDEWNTWYDSNLRVLLAVPGIGSAQRFRVPGAVPSRYAALYTVSGPEVFESSAYRDAGGGGANSVRFRPAYQVWVRNLFADIDTAPSVASAQYLVTLDGANAQPALQEIDLTWGRAVALHRTTPFRGFAVVAGGIAESLRGRADVTVYAPHSVRLPAR